MSRLFIILQYLLPHHLLSRLVGRFAESRRLRKPLIRAFIRRYKVDMSLAKVHDIDSFENFNDFFTRELRDGVRPISDKPGAIVSPADGAISQLGTISDGLLLQAKGRHYSCESLLGNDSHMAELFSEGKFATVYLSPKDYHRVHMPFTGVLQKTIYVPGKLFSVNQITAGAVPDLFARNERLVCLFQTEIGAMAVVLVGAMIVAGIDTVWAGQVCPVSGRREIRVTDYSKQTPPIELNKGAELGRFRLGSTAIVLLGHGVMELDPELEADSAVAMGQPLGQVAGLEN